MGSPAYELLPQRAGWTGGMDRGVGEELPFCARYARQIGAHSMFEEGTDFVKRGLVG
jgi:hypothetical protein